jgi:phosphoglycolate phosphatase-like HAD superfamily hydrolase
MTSFDAVIFDLDDTLVDTSALREFRDSRQWQLCLRSLHLAKAFPASDHGTPVASLPKSVASTGAKIGLVTNSPSHYATALLDQFGIEIPILVSGSDGIPPKPNPDGLLAAARAIGVSPGACLYVGDDVGDVGAAAAAGMASAGVAWDSHFPPGWRRAWPDVAVASPERLLEFVGGAEELRPFAEALTLGLTPTAHPGSLLALGDRTYSLGRYFRPADRRHAAHGLSQLVLQAKDPTNSNAVDAVARLFGKLAARATSNPPDVVVSVPPAPGQSGDRFDAVRAKLAEVWDAVDGAGLIRMRHAVDGYKRMNHSERATANSGRFECASEAARLAIKGNRVALIDDVFTSGGQAYACRDVLLAAGAASVSVATLTAAQDCVPVPMSCELCNGGLVVRRRRRDNHPFLACENYFRTGCGYMTDLPDSGF